MSYNQSNLVNVRLLFAPWVTYSYSECIGQPVSYLVVVNCNYYHLKTVKQMMIEHSLNTNRYRNFSWNSKVNPALSIIIPLAK